MNVQVLGELDAVQLAELDALLTRCERADHHPALAEPQREAAARADLGGHGAQVVLAYEDEDGLVGVPSSRPLSMERLPYTWPSIPTIATVARG